jgi:putative pyruvate formate lyase activating enzyme
MGNGFETTTSGLAAHMLKLQRQGAHNVNFVTPGHFMPQIMAALWLAIPQGFGLPLVWNSSGYELADVLSILDGVVDIYLPDMKYSTEDPATRFSAAPGYREYNRAVRGLIIRHLVLPGGAAGSRETLRWIAENLGVETHIALMNQFFPAHQAQETAGIDRKITVAEYDEAVEALEEYGLENGWVQE